MTKTSYVAIPAGSEDAWLRGLKSGDRFQFSKIVRNDTLLSKRRKNGIRQRSLLPALSALWAAFSDAERLAWKTAGTQMSLSGWQLFVQDQSIRIKNDMAGEATPVATHQSWVGKILINSPATETKLLQVHPASYWIIKKVYGKKGMYEPIEITESFGLPLLIGLSYKSSLVSAGANPYAKFYAKIWNSYQGVDDEHILNIDLNLSQGWTTTTATLSSLRGIIIGYTLYIELHDVTGSFWCDNIKATHNGQNWARDPFMKQMSTTFTAQFKQIPKHWAPVILPNGAEYDTVYEDF